MIRPSDWLTLKLKLPKEYLHLCDLCYDFEKLTQHLLSLKMFGGSAVSMEDMAKIQIESFRIISEYKGVIKEGVGEETLKEVSDDIVSTLSRFFEKGTGRLLDISQQFSEEDLPSKFPLFIAPLITFFHSRIYDSLKQATEDYEGNFTKYFTKITSDKAIGHKKEIKEKSPKKLTEEENELNNQEEEGS